MRPLLHLAEVLEQPDWSECFLLPAEAANHPDWWTWWRRGSARPALPVLISVSTNDRRLPSPSSTDAAHPSRCTLRQQLEGTDGHPVLRRPRPILTTPRHRRRRVGGRFEQWLSEATVLIEGGPLADVGAIHCR